MKILFRNAYILSMCDNQKDVFRGDVITDDNKITYVGEVKEHHQDFDRIIDCSHYLLMPTFKNGHTHSAMVYLRSLADDLKTIDWLHQYCFPTEELLTPIDVYTLDKLAFLEYFSSGIGMISDQYYYPFSTLEASNEFGIRTVINATVTSYLPKDKLEEFYLQNNDKTPFISFVFSLHAEYTSNENDVNDISELIHQYHLPFFTHLGETKQEVEDCYQRRNMSPLEYFSSKGLFDYGGGIYHGIYLSDNDIDTIKDKNISIVINMGSNAKLVSGIPDILRYQKEGINLVIGTDGAASNNSLDMFKEMTLIYSFTKLMNHDPSVLDPYDILKMATINFNKAYQYYDNDTIQEGKLADLILIDLYKPNMQPIHNIVKNLVYAGNKDNIYLTMINGHIIYENHQFFINENVEDIYKKVQDISLRLTKDVK